MGIHKKLTSIALCIDERIGKRVVIRSLKDHPWLLRVDSQTEEVERAVFFRALITVMTRFGPDKMIAIMPVSSIVEKDEFVEYILMVGVHVTASQHIPSLEHLRGCRDHQLAIYNTFSDFLTYIGFALGVLETADAISPVRFTCPS